MTPTTIPQGRLDLLCEEVILRTLDEFGSQQGWGPLREPLAPVVRRLVAEYLPAEALTPEAIAEQLGILKPRRKP